MKQSLLTIGLIIMLGFTSCGEQRVEKEVIIEREVDMDALPGMMHTVYFWLKPDLNEADEQAFLNGVRSLETVSTVRNFFIGPPAGTESRDVVDNTFSYALIIWFDNVEDHLAYQVDPIHLKFVEENKDKWERVRVRDNALME